MEKQKGNNCPRGYAQTVCDKIKELHPGFAKKFEGNSYCGFEIYETTFLSGSPNGEFRVWCPKNFPLGGPSFRAMRTGVCDSFEDAKYFVDQILFLDYTFKQTLLELEKNHELKCRKTVVSLLLQNA